MLAANDAYPPPPPPPRAVPFILKTRKEVLSGIKPFRKDRDPSKSVVAQLPPHTTVIDDRLEDALDPPSPEDFKTVHTKPPSIRGIIAEAFEQENLSLEDLTPYRIRVAYRIVRYLGWQTGTINDHETLNELDNIHVYDSQNKRVDPWYFPRQIGEMEIPLIPSPPTHTPDHPDQYIKQINNYTHHVRRAYANLSIRNGSINLPHYGRLGIVGIDNPDTLYATFPTRGELLAFEEYLIQTVTDILIGTHKPISDETSNGTGVSAAVEWLRDEMGFTTNEARATLGMVKKHIRTFGEIEPESERAIMVMRLENFVSRARASINFREEMAGLKQLSLIHGLTKNEESVFETEVAKLVKEFQQSDSPHMPEALPERVLKNLPEPGRVPSRSREEE